MKKIFYLPACKTCLNMMAELKLGKDFEIQDIKADKISPDQLEDMRNQTGSYDAFFSKRSLKFRAWNLQDKELTEWDKRDLILKEYTFLKPPVIIIENEIIVGIARATVDAIRKVIR